MSRYEKYKNSGIDWIGDLPEDWKTFRIKNVASIVNGSTPSSSVEEYWDGEIIWATPGDFNKFDKIIDDSENKITDAGYKSCGTSLVPVGSVVLTTRAPIGNVLITGKELCTNQGCKTLIPNRVESRFLYYIISNSTIELNVLGQGTTFLELSKESLGTFKLPFPKFEEQLTIANYLDQETQKIDRLIANKKAQAEKLKELRQIEINNAVTKGLNRDLWDLPDDLDKNNSKNQENPAIKPIKVKDSGIEWLGKIPKHWEVKRLKDLVNRIGDGIHSTPNYVDNSDIYFVNGNNLIQGEIKIFDNTDCIDEDEYSKYKLDFSIGTLLISINGTIGNLAFYKGEKIVLGKSAAYIDFTTKLHNFFLYFFLQSYMVSNIFELSFSGTTIKNLSLFTMRNLRVFLPPLDEQIQIANYLQQRTTAIDQLIKNVEAQIEKLQELRKIKIYEAVTGKIKVSET